MGEEMVARHWKTGKPVQIKHENGKIVSMKETEQSTDSWVAPGLIDIQVNGIGGFNINDIHITKDTVKNAVQVLHSFGVTHFYPTVITGSKERMLKCIRTIREACESDAWVERTVLGIHVEGPFISEEDGPRGAHKREYVRNPDWEEFLQWEEASGGRIRKVTLAPEKPGAISFIENLVQRGIVAAIGHSHANAEQIQQAIRAGVTMSTHLGNGAHPYIKRHPNYIWEQLADERLWAGLIADGHHLPPSTLKVMVQYKGKKAIITSDAVSLAGSPPGVYGEVTLEENGFLHLTKTPDILSGSATPLHQGISNVVLYGIRSLGDAIELATKHPAELFGIQHQGYGQLEEGAPAHLIIFEWDDQRGISIKKTVLSGETVYSQ